MTSKERLELAVDAIRDYPFQTSARWNENYEEFIVAAKRHGLPLEEGMRLELQLRTAEAVVSIFVRIP